MTFALNYHFHGLDVFGYHALNLTVHLLSSILLWWLMLLTFAAPRLRNEEISKYKGWIALFSALIFTAHPVQTQAVTYITQRYSSLSAMFYLAALALYMRGRIGQRKEGALCWAGAVISAILGMFTKEHVITLPFLIVVAQWLFLSEPRGLEQKSRWPGIGIVLFFALALIVPAIYSFNIQGILGQRFISESHGQEIVTSGNYFLTQLRVLTTYISLLFLPIKQNFDYDYPLSQSLWEGPTFLVLFSPGAHMAGGQNGTPPAIDGMGILVFITLSVESSIIPIANVIFEHRLYLPLAGFACLLGGDLYSNEK